MKAKKAEQQRLERGEKSFGGKLKDVVLLNLHEILLRRKISRGGKRPQLYKHPYKRMRSPGSPFTQNNSFTDSPNKYLSTTFSIPGHEMWITCLICTLKRICRLVESEMYR